MAAQCDLGGDEGFKIVRLVVGGAVGPFGIRGRRRILGIARGGFGGLFGEDVIQAGIKGLLDLGAAAEVAIQPLLLGGLETVAGAVGDIGMLGGSAVAIAGTGVLVVGKLGLLWHRFTRNRRLCTVAGALEQRISLQFLLDEGRTVE